MATKALNIDQHQILHQHYPGDCCLCRTEKRIRELESDLAAKDAEIAELKAKLAIATKSCWIESNP